MSVCGSRSEKFYRSCPNCKRDFMRNGPPRGMTLCPCGGFLFYGFSVHWMRGRRQSRLKIGSISIRLEGLGYSQQAKFDRRSESDNGKLFGVIAPDIACQSLSRAMQTVYFLINYTMAKKRHIYRWIKCCLNENAQ
jgi:hypothetical protein